MISALLSAITKDVLSFIEGESFFALSAEERRLKLEQSVGVSCPRGIQAYLLQVTEQLFLEDVQSLVSVLASAKELAGPLTVQSNVRAYDLQRDRSDLAGLSVEFWSDLQALLGEIQVKGDQDSRQNAFVAAIATVLTEEVADVFDRGSVQPSHRVGPETRNYLTFTLRTGRVTECEHRIQTFLRDQTGVASPVIQSPSPLSPEEKTGFRSVLRDRYPGSYAVFEVEPSLGGGIRLFVNGRLLDESWMTRIAHLLATLDVR